MRGTLLPGVLASAGLRVRGPCCALLLPFGLRPVRRKGLLGPTADPAWPQGWELALSPAGKAIAAS